MKKSITFILLLFPMLLLAQDSTFVNQLNDSTFVKTTITFDSTRNTRTTVETQYDSAGFSQFLFDMVVTADNEFHQAELDLIQQQRKVNQGKKNYLNIKNIYEEFSKDKYNQQITDRIKQRLSGEWKLMVGKETYKVETTPAVTILKDQNSNKRMRIKFDRLRFLRLTPSGDQDPFVKDPIVLEERTNPNGAIRYIGYTKEGTKVILRR